MFKKLIATSLLVLVAVAAQAQQKATLSELVARLISVNYDIRLSQINTQKAGNNVTATPFLPTLSANARAQQNAVGNTTNTLGVGASLNWTLFDGLAMFDTYERSKQQLSISQLSEHLKLEDMVSQVKGQYYLIVSLNSRAKVARELVNLSRIRYEDALLKYSIEALSGLEMKLAKTDLNADSTNLIRQIEAVDVAYIKLNNMLNFELSDRGYIQDSIAINTILDRDEMEQLVANQNTEILLSKKGVVVSDLNVKLAKSSMFPTLDFALGYNYNAVNERPATDFRNSNGINFGVTLGVKIFDGLEIQRGIKNARLDQQSSQVSLDNVRQSVMSDFTKGYTNYENNLQLIDFERENASAMRLNLEVAMERYRLGELSGIDFRTIQQQYLGAVDRQINALYLAKSSEVSLFILAGIIIDK